MYKMIIFVFIFLFVDPALSILIFGSKEVSIERLAQCQGEDATTPVRVDNVVMNYDRTTMKINAQFVFDIPVDGRIGLKIELIRCRYRQEPDSCELHSQHRFSFQCRQLHEKGRLWTDYVEHIPDLPNNCPIPAREYNMTDVSINLNNMQQLPLATGYWKVTAKGTMKNKLIFCISSDLDIQIHRNRKKSRSDKTT